MEILTEMFYDNLYYIIGFVLLIGIIYFNLFKIRDMIKNIVKFFIDFIKNILVWLKPSFEDPNGQASSRRLTAFSIIVTYISCRHKYAVAVTDSYYLLLALIVDALFVLLLFGIVTFQQIISLKENLKANSKDINLPPFPPDQEPKPE